MHGWILNRSPQHALRSDSYGVHRLLAQAQQRNIAIDVIAPNELDIIAEGQGRHRFFIGWPRGY